MRKKILAAVLAATMPEIINGKGQKKEKEVANVQEPINEKVTKEVVIDEILSGENITEEVQIEENLTQEIIVEKTVTDDIGIEIQSSYKYEFEGKYWIRYSEYGHVGWHFDGSKAISKMENCRPYNSEYFVEDDLLNIGGQSYIYEISDGKLGLDLLRDGFNNFAYYEEVEKAEFDSIFK